MGKGFFTSPPEAPGLGTPIERPVEQADGGGSLVRVRLPRFSHGEALVLAGLAVYALMGLLAVFNAMVNGTIAVPHWLAPYLVVIGPTVPLLVAWLIRGLKSGQWAVDDGTPVAAVASVDEESHFPPHGY